MATRKQWKEARINPPQATRGTFGVDKRVKLTESDRERIRVIYARKEASTRELAGMFGVSRKLIQLIISPERLARAKALYKERRKDGRYYKKEKHTKYMQNYRARLREVNPVLSEGDKAGDNLKRINEKRRVAKIGRGQDPKSSA